MFEEKNKNKAKKKGNNYGNTEIIFFYQLNNTKCTPSNV